MQCPRLGTVEIASTRGLAKIIKDIYVKKGPEGQLHT